MMALPAGKSAERIIRNKGITGKLITHPHYIFPTQQKSRRGNLVKK